MPIALQPLPRRIRRTHENFSLGEPARLSASRRTRGQIIAALQQILEPLFPVMEVTDSGAAETAVIRFVLFSEEDSVPEEIPADVRAEAYRLRVSPREIDIAAGSESGWLVAARQLLGLRVGEELTGIQLLDWPSFSLRQIDLGWPAVTVSPAAFETLFRLLSLGRLNRLGLRGEEGESELPGEIRQSAARHGIHLVPTAEDRSFRWIETPTIVPPYSRQLPALQEAALAAERDGRREFVLSLDGMDAQTALESLAYGILFAGDSAWNPQKTDLKAFRRSYALRRFGFDSRAPVQVIDALEEGVSLADPGQGIGERVGALLDPFAAASVSGVLRPDERATALQQSAASALTAMGPLQPDSEERAAALQGLQWSAQRLKMLGRLLGTAERVRELYRSAYVATASAKAVSDRLLRAADMLESEARVLDEYRGEWHALWRRERLEPYDPETEIALRAPGEALVARAARLRELRNRYIQTGSLPSPAEEGLEKSGTRLTLGLVPARLPPQPSPAWWPEGGAARLRVEVECPDPAAGIPWPVQVDFRALAGETGAFHVRSARLLPLTETDEAGPEKPCQLLRSGFAFIAEPGPRSYFLYLDPEPSGDPGYREVRTSQSKTAVRLENRQMRVRLAPSEGFMSAWQLLDPERELLPEEARDEGRGTRDESSGTDFDLAGTFASRLSPLASRLDWRLRVLETGPLLARVRCEHPDGQIRQFDLAAGQSWIDVSVNAAWEDFSLALRPELGDGPVEAVFGTDAGTRARPLVGSLTEEALWAGLRAADGLTVGLVLPESPAVVTLAAEGLRVSGPSVGRVLLFAGREDDDEAGGALLRLAAAHQQPPRVRLGVIEYRRVREF